MRLRHLVTIGPRPPIGTELHPDADVTFVPMEAIADGLGGLDISQTRPFSEVASGSYNYFAEGDLLLAKVTPCFENGKKALAQSLSNDIGYATSEVHVIRPGVDRIHPKYLFYLLCSEDFRAGGIASMTGAGGLRRVSNAAVLNYRPSVTNVPTQMAIADFLDRETARIEQLIEKKQWLVEVLGEKRQTVVSHAVTKGLNPDVPKKDSGIGWMGNIPAHWEVRCLGQIGTFKKCNGGTKTDELPDGVSCIRYGDLYTHHRYFITESRSYVSSDNALNYTPVRYGDILFAASGETIEEIGKSAVNLIESDAVSGGDLILLRTAIEADARFMGYATDSTQATFQKGCLGRGITVMHIYSDQLKYLYLVLPPLTEQRAIAAYLDDEMANIDALMAKIRETIDRLCEFRAALITAAVTGRIDVSTWGKQGTADRRLDRIEEATSA